MLTASGCDPFSGLKSESVETQTVIVEQPLSEQGDFNSIQSDISADGRLVAFASDATNLVAEPSRGSREIYVRDSASGEISLVSSGSGGEPADDDSKFPAISADGRYVVFESNAANLVTEKVPTECMGEYGLESDCTQVYLKDLESGDIKLVSSSSEGVPSNGVSTRPAISADGRYVAFVSTAEDLAENDGNGRADVFIKDTNSSKVRMVSVNEDGEPADGASDMPAISSNGRMVAFKSVADNLDGGAGNGATDVFVKDMDTGTVTLASSDSRGNRGDKASGYEALDISADGRFVAFESEATNLVAGDRNQGRDIFLKELISGETKLVSTSAEGIQGNDNSFLSVSISADGRYVAFNSYASNLVPGDGINKADIFVKDVISGKITMVSTSSADEPGNGKSDTVAIASSGGIVAFASDAGNLVAGDTNGKTDIFVKNLDTREIIRISSASASEDAGSRTGP